MYRQIPLHTNTSQALIKWCTSELIITVLIRTYMFFFLEPWKTGDFTWIEKGLWSVKIFVVFTTVVYLFRQWPIKLSLWIPWVFHSKYKRIEFRSEYIYIYSNTNQVQTRRWASEWVAAKLMIIYFFIPQISKTNEDRGAGAREEREPGRSGKREQKLKRQSFVVYYR